MTALLQLVPVFAGVAAGHLLVRTGMATREQGRFLFVFAFHVCVPALVFDVVSDTEPTRKVVMLPLTALLAQGRGEPAALGVRRRPARQRDRCG